MKIAIASGKGGTGKTTLSTNLASYIAQQKQVALLDLDVEEPNSGLFLNLPLVKTYKKTKKVPFWDKEKCTLCGKCQQVCKFNAIIKLNTNIMVFNQLCHSCNACLVMCPVNALSLTDDEIGFLNHYSAQNFDFIESRLNIGQEQAVPLIKQTIDFADSVFNQNVLQIYDSPPGTSCPVVETCKNVDFVILVTEPTPFGFNDLKLAIETMKKLKKPIGLVINKYGIGDESVEDYCKVNNIDIITKIKHSKNIAKQYSSGNLLQLPEFEQNMQQVKAYIEVKQKELGL